MSTPATAASRSESPPELPAADVVRLTVHPMQRAGAWAVAILAGRAHPREVDVHDLDAVAARIVGDVVRAALAGKEYVAYDWWKVLFALYPNAEPTHAKRAADRAVLTAAVERYFVADVGGGPGGGPLRPCTFCGSPAAVLWSKSRLPLFDTTNFLNTLPPRVAGWPVCRACRVAMWALPYAASLTAGSATVLTCDDEGAERAFAAANAERAERIQQLGFTALAADAVPEAVALWALRAHARHRDRDQAATLWSFKNDNQEPWLRVSETRLAVVPFLRALRGDPDAYRGWRRLEAAVTRRSADGTVIRHGRDVVARALFDSPDRPRDGLLAELASRVQNIEKLSARTLRDWRALHDLYLREMCGMDTAVLKPAAELLVEWIGAEQNPRGRFNEYSRVAGRAFALQRLMMQAAARLYLDGRRPPDVTEVTVPLFASTEEGWRLRGQLFFEVVAGLVARNIQVGTRRDVEDDEDDIGGTEAVKVGFDPVSGSDDEDGGYA